MQLTLPLASTLSTDVLIQVGGSAMWALLYWLYCSARRSAERVAAGQDPAHARVKIGLLVFLGLALNPVLVGLTNPTALWTLALPTLVAVVLFARVRRLDRVGVLGVDRTVASGIDYARSLRLSSRSLSFAGVGAHKLTREPAFEKAMQLISQSGRPARFLLLAPDEELLVTAARRRSLDHQEFKRRVVKSLRTLKELKEDRGLNIEVRFYSGNGRSQWPALRLMLINDRLCLLSYYVWGEQSEGRQQPQLQIGDTAKNSNGSSFYLAFHNAFEAEWEASNPWDFESYLQ